MFTARSAVEGMLAKFGGKIVFQAPSGQPSAGYTNGQVYESASDALTAHAGGGQANGLPLVAAINRVTTVGTIADSVLLPPSMPGASVTVINAGALSMNVFPSTGDAINALAANAAFAVAATKVVTFYCTVSGQWHSQLSA
jgi:hypothetical protein